MEMDGARELMALIRQGEHQQLDFKFEISDAKKIARTLSAFSNTNGGRLLIGVKDNGRISGIRSEEEFYMAEAAASLYCSPEINFNSRSHQVEGKTILEIIIPEAKEKPIKAKNEKGHWMAYIRVDDENFLASVVQFKVWKAGKESRGKLLEYSRNEKLLLIYLEDHRDSTLGMIQKGCGFKRQELVELLSRLVVFNVVKIEVVEGQSVFNLVEDPGGEANWSYTR